MYKSKILSRMQAVTILLVMDLFAAQASCPNCSPYTIVHSRDSTSGRIELECRNSSTLERLDIHGVKFWVNRTSADDRDLRNRSDFSVIEDHNNNVIRFTLTGDLEGRFTCGIKIDVANIRESPPLALISLQTDRPKVPCRTTFAATSGDSVIIDCPVKVGVFKKYYSVTWYKDEQSILEFDAPDHEMLTATEARYSIDRSSFALIIHSVDISYSNTSYRCDVFFTNPLSSTNNLIFSDVLLKLYVIGKPSIVPPTAIVSSDEEQPLFTCAVDYPAVPHLPTPEITWTYVNNKGVELTLTEDYHYTVSTNVARDRDGGMTLYSNFTLLRPCLAEDESAVVKCKAGFPGTKPSSSDAHLFKIANSNTECKQPSHSTATALKSDNMDVQTNNAKNEISDITTAVQILTLSVILLVIVTFLIVAIVCTCVRRLYRKEYQPKWCATSVHV